MKRVSYNEFIEWRNSIKKKDLFLDVGCWSGSTVLEMIDICDAYGIDFNKETLELADKRITNRLKYSDITKSINFDKKFDWVLCSEVIEHIREDDDALKNIAKVMSNDGKLILTTPRSLTLFELWDPAWIRWKFGGSERHYHYTLEELESKMSNAGLRILKFTTRGNIRWIIVRWINVILEHVLKVRFKLKNNYKEGFVDWMIVAEKK